MCVYLNSHSGPGDLTGININRCNKFTLSILLADGGLIYNDDLYAYYLLYGLIPFTLSFFSFRASVKEYVKRYNVCSL